MEPRSHLLPCNRTWQHPKNQTEERTRGRRVVGSEENCEYFIKSTTYLPLHYDTLEIETKDEERFKCSVRSMVLRFCSSFSLREDMYPLAFISGFLISRRARSSPTLAPQIRRRRKNKHSIRPQLPIASFSMVL